MTARSPTLPRGFPLALAIPWAAAVFAHRPTLFETNIRAPNAERPDARWPAAIAGLAARARARWIGLFPRPAADAPQGEAHALLCLSVSESGWRATLHPADGTKAIETADRALPDEAALSTPEMLRRAIRAISPATRDSIGSIRLVIQDRAAAIVDNRVLKLRGVDPVAIRQAGAQELGSPRAVHAFQPFGSVSEQEMERGVYAFLPAERICDYLGAMDSLSVKLTAVLPAWLLCLQAQRQSFAAIEIRANGATLMLADPESGAVACRELPVGTRSFAEAIASATFVSTREAADGLQRRFCLTPGSAAVNAPSTTELALAPILATLRTELLATLEYFVFQRLAAQPERLLVSGDAARVRGLADWLGGVLGLAPQPAPAPSAALPDGYDIASESPALNLLQDTPTGLLRIGRIDYRFLDGRFRPVQTQGRSATRPRTSVSDLAGQKLSLPMLRQTAAALAAVPGPGAIAPSLAAGILGLGLWVTVYAAANVRLQADAQLSQRLAGDAMLRDAALHPRGPAPAAAAASQPWSGKLSRMAALIPDGVWLTALTTLPDPAEPGRQRVLLEGAVPASPGDDYIASVAGFIDRLKADSVFMKDVASIAFEGASLVQGPAPNVAGFTIMIMLAPNFASQPRHVLPAATAPG